MANSMKISGKELLQKAMQVLDDSLEGRPVDPNALDTAIKMTQYVWMGAYSDIERERQITEALRNKWENDVDTKDEK